MASSWLDPRVVVGPSVIHGLGLHTTAPIAAGEIVTRWNGEVVPRAELESLKRLPRYDCASLSDSTIMIFRPDDPVIYGNHSCDPNLWMEHAVTVSACRDIAASEELTVDYGLHSDDPTWEMICHCTARLCRKLITGTDWRLSELQERYNHHFSPYLRAKFERLGTGPSTP